MARAQALTVVLPGKHRKDRTVSIIPGDQISRLAALERFRNASISPYANNAGESVERTVNRQELGNDRGVLVRHGRETIKPFGFQVNR